MALYTTCLSEDKSQYDILIVHRFLMALLATVCYRIREASGNYRGSVYKCFQSDMILPQW